MKLAVSSTMPERMDEAVSQRGRLLLLYAWCVFFSALLIIHSQSGALYGDEAFHLLAARLLSEGKRPYLDFFYQHTPFYIGFVALWIKIFGNSWRAAHWLSALFTSGCLFLTARFTFARIPEPGWKLPCSLAAACFFAMNPTVMECATTGHPYSMSLFFLMAVVSLAAVNMENARLRLFLTGLCAGASSAASLLAAPLVPIVLLWLLRFRRAGGVAVPCLFFCAGASIPFLPLAWYAIQAPQRVFADIVLYSVLLRRQGAWAGLPLWRQDLWAMAEWLRSPWAVMLFLLSAVGFVYLRKKGKESFASAEFPLIFWIISGLVVYLMIPQPTFAQYFILIFPLLCVLAGVALFAIGSGVFRDFVPVWLMVGVLGVYSFEGSQVLYRQTFKSESSWETIEVVAKEVDRITPGGGSLLASEEIYFTTPRLYFPPSGVENHYATRLMGTNALAVGIVPDEEITAQIEKGTFAVIAYKDYEPRVAVVRNSSRYAQHFARGRYIIWIRR